MGVQRLRITLGVKGGVGEARLRALLRILIDGAGFRVELLEALSAEGQPRRLPASTWRAYTANELMAMWEPEDLLPGFHGGDAPATMDDLEETMKAMDAAFGHLIPAARHRKKESLKDVVLRAFDAARDKQARPQKPGAKKGTTQRRG
jgi:hypothetical protein